MTTMVWVAIGWLAGIAESVLAMPAAGACALAAGIGWRLGKRGLATAALAIGIGLLGGAGVQRLQARTSAPELWEGLAGREITVYGHIAEEPIYRSTSLQVCLSVEAVEQRGSLVPASGRVLVTLSRYPERSYGQRLAVTGHVEPVGPSSGAYGRYLAAHRVDATMAWVKARSLPGDAGSPLLRLMYVIKDRARESIERILPEPEAGLLSGILLGLGHTLPHDVEEAFRRSGLTHVIVISGFNIGLVLQQTVLVLERWSPRRLTLLVAAGAIAVYTLFVGPSPPVVRAAIMGGFLVLAELVGRKPHVLTSLSWASLLMTAANPALVWDVSFQLSMVSTLALIGLTPMFESWTLSLLGRHLAHPNAQSVTRLASSYLLSTCAAQLLTFPILWYHFQEISLLALPANVLALPAQPPITILGAFAALAGWLWKSLGMAVAALAYVPLWWTITVAEAFGTLSIASWQVAAPSPWLLVGFYGFVGGALMFRHLARAGSKAITWIRQRVGVLSAAFAALLLVLAILSQLAKLPDGRLHVHVFDVGQGDGILIRTPSGTTVLVDGGPDPLVLASRLHQALPLWERKIDLLVATHADADHLSGLAPLPSRYAIGMVLQPPDMGDDPLGLEWQRQLAAAEIVPTVALRGQSVRLDGGVTLEVLHPGTEALAQGDRNENSVVILLRMGEFSMLLTGDIEAEAERELLQMNLVRPVTVLKVAHHGSPSSSGEAFLQACQPEIAVISVGAENRVGHPAADVLARLGAIGAWVLRTDEMGTIELVTDGDHLWIQ
ncbi:MAG: DNA internalization-related competence protein ComEC/Rec2 [Anaerolineae bacterium]